MSRRAVLILCGCIVLCAATAPYAVADSEYNIEASDSVDTESRTVTVDGDDYDVDTVGRARIDETVSVDVESPADEAAQVYLYNGERDIIETREPEGSGSVSIDMGGYDAGAYVLAVLDDENGTIEDIQPLVVAGWDSALDLNTTAADEIKQGTQLSATVTISEYTEMPEPESIELVFTRDDSVVTRTDASKVGTGEYEATIDIDRETGTYRIYANVRNTTTVENRQEVVGVTDSHVVEVKSNVSESNEDADSPPTESSGGGGGGAIGQPSTTATETSNTSATPVSTTTSTTTQTPGPDTPNQSSPTATPDDGSEQMTTSTVSTTTTENNLITAVSQTATPTSTPASTPGFGMVSALVALAGSGLLLYRRQT
jgi:PGF-CTERM protein